MEDWKQRVVDEYKQLHGRYERLSAMIVKYEAGTLDNSYSTVHTGWLATGRWK